jgi:hypothetical protein
MHVLVNGVHQDLITYRPNDGHVGLDHSSARWRRTTLALGPPGQDSDLQGYFVISGRLAIGMKNLTALLCDRLRFGMACQPNEARVKTLMGGTRRLLMTLAMSRA